MNLRRYVAALVSGSRMSMMIIAVVSGTVWSNSVQARHIYSSCPYPQHEIGVGYGYMSGEQFGIAISSIFLTGILSSLGSDAITKESYKFIGPVHITYKYFFKERLSIGGGLLYSYNTIKSTYSSGEVLNYDLHTFSVVPRFDFYYIRNPKFALYGALGAGVTVMALKEQAGSSEKGVTFGYQVTPLAMRIGRDFGFVLELGIGSYGLANAGFSYRHYDRPWSFN